MQTAEKVTMRNAEFSSKKGTTFEVSFIYLK